MSLNTSADSGKNASENLHDVVVVEFVSDSEMFYVIVVVQIFLCGVVSVMGIGTNAVNIVVFIRQGVFTDSCTVSLLALAVADMFSVTTMLWLSVSYSLALAEPPDLTWNPYDIMYMTAGWPHTISGLISRCLTAFVAFERCICVVLPFRVKSIFTPRCTLTSAVFIFAYFLLSYTPVYVMNRFRYVTDPETNATRLVLTSSPDWKLTDGVLSSINLFALNFGSVAIVLICTAVTVSRVKLSKAWRESMTTGNNTERQKHLKTKTVENYNSNSENNSYKNETKVARLADKETSENNSPKITQDKKLMSCAKVQKEKKLIQMITLISVIFLVCYSPNISFIVTFSFNKEIRVNGTHNNLAWVMWSVIFLFETINSSTNLFVYYRMSSRYRKVLDAMMGFVDE